MAIERNSDVGVAIPVGYRPLLEGENVENLDMAWNPVSDRWEELDVFWARMFRLIELHGMPNATVIVRQIGESEVTDGTGIE